MLLLLLLSCCCCWHTVFAWAPTSPVLYQQRCASHSLCSLQSFSSAGEGDTSSDPVLRIPLMEAELATLIEKKNLDEKISDSTTSNEDRRLELEEAIKDAKTIAEFGVRRAQVRFYDAFSDGDLDSMDKVWSTEQAPTVRCIHPGMESLEGREQVMQSWAQILNASPNFTIKPTRVKIDICGLTAICTCIEETPNGGKIEALNVYYREGGDWRMTLHMASPIIMRQPRGPPQIDL